RLAVRGGEVAERSVVGAEELRVPVDDVEGLHPSPSRVAGPPGAAPAPARGPRPHEGYGRPGILPPAPGAPGRERRGTTGAPGRARGDAETGSPARPAQG